jgi:hypothetical protein
VRIPTPQHLDEHPEDGVLALIDEALLLAVRSLVAVHPDIDDPERPYGARAPSPASRSARQVISRAYALIGSLADYRTTRAAEDDEPTEDDIPF